MYKDKVGLGSWRVLRLCWLLVNTIGEEELALLALGPCCANFGPTDLEQK
jgi:hypothetical protein